MSVAALPRPSGAEGQSAEEDWDGFVPVRLRSRLPGTTAVFLPGAIVPWGEVAGRVGRIEAGLIAEVRHRHEQEAALQVHPSGSIVGETSLFGELPQPCGARLEAMLPTRIRWAEAPVADPTALPLALAVIAARTRHQLDVSLRRRFHNQTQQIAECLLRLRDCSALGSEGGLAQLPHQSLAVLVGTGRTTITRVLSQFTRRGWVDRPTSSSIDLDVEALRAFVSGTSPTAVAIASELRRSQDALARHLGLLD